MPWESEEIGLRIQELTVHGGSVLGAFRIVPLRLTLVAGTGQSFSCCNCLLCMYMVTLDSHIASPKAELNSPWAVITHRD